jgi:hypothetical protein
MKLIITESQKDKIIETLIFKYFDKQNYNQLEIDNNIYFVKNIGDKYADIRFDKSDGWCYIQYGLISFFSRMMGIEESDIKEVIGRWVEHTLQMEVKYTRLVWLIYPRPVEHTLQMEVKYTQPSIISRITRLNIPYNNI